MKCVQCGTDSKYKDRTGHTCPKCRKRFVFEPKDGDTVTDMLFHNAVKAISGDGKIRWGVEHLYYEVCRRKRPKRAPWPLIYVVLAVAVFAIAIGFVNPQKYIQFACPCAGIALISLGTLIATRIGKYTVPMKLEVFNGYWNRWKGAHDTPGLIARAPQPAKPKQLEADIGDYSFDRAVICDRARTVDLLVANNFHFENNCAILAVNGYPQGPFATIRKMLQRNPKLQVFVLHDATPVGCRVAQKVATERDWFGGRLHVIDLGLRPNLAGPFRGLLLRAEDRYVEATGGITAPEAAWLTNYQLELAAIRPEQVLKRLFHGLGAHKDDSPTDNAGGVTNCGSFDSGGSSGSDSSGSSGGEGGGDAFG